MAKSKRPVNAFADVENSASGELQRSGSKSSEVARQFSNTGETMTDGGNTGGRTMKGVSPYMVPAFQGRSGQPDNQDIHRPKGST